MNVKAMVGIGALLTVPVLMLLYVAQLWGWKDDLAATSNDIPQVTNNFPFFVLWITAGLTALALGGIIAIVVRGVRSH